MSRTPQRTAGGILIIGVVLTFLLIQTAQVLTPHYDPNDAALSGIGSPFFGTLACIAERCNDIPQPASALFIVAAILCGVLLLLAATHLRRAGVERSIALPVALLGAALLLLAASYIPLYFVIGDPSFIFALWLHLASSAALVAIAAFLAIHARVFTRDWARHLSRITGLAMVLIVPVYTYMTLTNAHWPIGAGSLERIGFDLMFAWFLAYGMYLLRR
jgi:hypothetical membrane protein